ncbi:MAG TPA: diadenylate cyclase CdaA [Myxococcota bacterium]|nr:diadenylate cyclase CdaA [Myxococcota bacterium]
MIETLWGLLRDLLEYFGANFDPVRDVIDIVLVTIGIYWLLILIRGTRAFQIMLGLLVLYALSLLSEIFQLVTLRTLLENFVQYGVLIVIVLFQHDIRRALARVGRGFFPTAARRRETQILEEVVRATQELSRKRIGALIVLEREIQLGDQIETGTQLDATVHKDLLISIFNPYSPLHDGAVMIQNGRLSSAGCILPLTMRDDLPDGVGTRHRAAVGLSEETDAVVVVVSEESGGLSVALGGALVQGLDAPNLRAVLRDILNGERNHLRDIPATELAVEPRPAEGAAPEQPAADATLTAAG